MMGANFVLQSTPTTETSNRSRRVLEAMVRSCKQMERLVRDFGDLAEIEGGSVVLRTGIADAEQLLEIAAEAARPAAATRRVTVVVEPSDLVDKTLRCDRERILRALSHLIDNAVRAAPEDSAVTLRARPREREGENENLVRLDVTDRGPGFSEETLAHLYDRRYHASRAGRPGAGLGLAIARGFAVAHGGSIEIASQRGTPTQVSILLPR
jgi:signal transduction histidine kinase